MRVRMISRVIMGRGGDRAAAIPGILGRLVRDSRPMVSGSRLVVRVLAACVVVAALVAGGGLLSPSSAAAQSQCPAARPSFFGPCGPTFTLPEWGDAGGWKSFDQYSTIQFGDVLGNGRDQLIGRSADGIEIWDFDTTLGQWRPAVDSQNKPMILTGFADPPPLTQAHPTYDQTDWTAFDHSVTIQVADVLGNGRDQIIARASSGIIVLSYTPGANGAAGSWTQLSGGGPFSDADGFGGLFGLLAASSIHTADLTGDGKADVFGVTPSGAIKAYEWDGSGFSQLPAISATLALSAQVNTLHASPMINGRQELWWSQAVGLVGVRLNDARSAWTYVPEHSLGGILPLYPFGLNETSPTPWGQSPAYYLTIRAVDVTGTSNLEFVGRGVDGLDVWDLTPSGDWRQLPTLTAFSDANGWNQEKYWRSIQYADLDGSASGQQEVLARGPNGVVVYKYNATSGAWDQLPSSISLTDDPWGSDASYYSTLRVGDASGDGRQDTLIARGPYGIRTWFYGRPGQTGWSAYLPSGYPAFVGVQQSAYAAASQLPAVEALLAPAGAATIRDFWTAENAPSAESLAGLQSTLANAAGCSGEQAFAPPQYQSCTPPSGSTAFTAGDWKTVINELLSEAWDAQQVVGFYGELDTIRQTLFIAESAELPAIAGKLNLDAATNTSTSFNTIGAMSAELGIAASVAYEFPALSAALWVASEIVSMLPSASPSLTSPFDGTYNQLQNAFAAGITQTQKALVSQSLQVRSDLNLSSLVSQLRQRGTWAMDDAGIASASNEGFALWVYKTLAPLIYTRYQITDCHSSGDCTSPSGAGVVGSEPNFTVIGPNPITDNTGFSGTPCRPAGYNMSGFPYGHICNFQALDPSIGNAIWGLIPANCDYQPGNPNTVWTFGCPLGVNPKTSILPALTSVKEYWDFPNQIGDPQVPSSLSGEASTTGSGASNLGRAASVNLRGTFAGIRRVNLSKATVVLDRVLFDPHGPGELLREIAPPAAAREAAASSPLPPSLGPTTLHNSGSGTFSGPLSAVPGQLPPSIQLRLTPGPGQRLGFGLEIGNVAIPMAPAACAAATIGSQSTSPFPLTLKVSLREPGSTPQTISVSSLFTCQLDRTGAIRALTVVQPRRPKLGPGMSVLVTYPGRLIVGQHGILTATVRNRTHSTAYGAVITTSLQPGLRIVSHTPRAIAANGQIAWHFATLRRGHAQTIRIKVEATHAVSRCSTIIASALLRNQVARTACIHVIAPRAPSSGLG